MKLVYFFFVSFLLSQTRIMAQTDPASILPDAVVSLEDIITETNDESYAISVFEELSDLAVHPIDINTATEDDLTRLYYLNDFQIFLILDYRKTYGELLSLNELELITGLREDLIRHILPYVTIGHPSPGPSPSSNNKYRLKHGLILRSRCSWPYREGFKDTSDSVSHFKGPPYSRLMKYEIRAGKNLRGGITLESDAGEHITWEKSQRGFDFSSAFIEIKDKGPIRKIILGDYRFDSGCGLVKGSGRRGKSSEVIPKQKLPGISRYASASESGFNRGLAAAGSFGKLNLRILLSTIKISARTEPADDGSTVFTGLNQSGLFRNETEAALKNDLRESQFGTGIGYGGRRFSINYNFLSTWYDRYYRFRIRTDRFSPLREANNFMYHSLDALYRRGNFLVNGEAAMDRWGHPALITGVTASLHPLLTLAMNFRYFHPGYYNPYASAFSESGVRNEAGFYLAVVTYPFRFLKLSAYIDQYRFPWLRYYSVAPERGKDVLLKSDVTINPSFTMVSLLKYEIKQTGRTTPGAGIGSTGSQRDLRFMTQIDYDSDNDWGFKTKIDIKHSVLPSDSGSYNGIFLSQDIRLKLLNDRITLNARYAIFDAPGWAARIYAYENDLLYAFSIPAFYRTGSRVYVSGRIRLTRQADLWFKYAETKYTAQYASGSGPDKREGSVFREVGIEVILRI